MKVLLVSEPGVDGVFRFVESLTHFLADQGVEIHYAYSDRRGSDRLETLVEFVRSRGGETFNLATGSLPSPSDIRAFTGLRAFVQKVQPDIIHSHSSKAGVLARGLMLLGSRIPQIYQPHAYSGMRPQKKIMRFVYDSIERVMGHCGITINISADEYAYALGQLRLPTGRAEWLTNGIDTTHFQPATPSDKIAVRRKLGLPVAAQILGTMGRASQQKDPLTTYRAFAAAAATNPHLVLFHVGKGELDPEINRFIAHHQLEKKVFRLPYLSTPVDFYQAIDGFILTSLYEGMSLAALEAMSCDLPLIVSQAPGNRDLSKLPLSHLWLAPIGDVEAFAKAICEWNAGRPGPSTNRTCAEWHFDSKQTFRNILALYERLRKAHLRRHPPVLPSAPGTPTLQPQPSSAKTGF
jgi:glycosyltransferase involved in cell wall biosynthesis